MDYRNAPIKFAEAGIDINTPPENLENFLWRKLDNTRTRTEGVLEGRPHQTDFLASSYFSKPTWTWTSSGDTFTASYPSAFLVGPCVAALYVGPLASGQDGILTIHEQPNQIPWPNEVAGTRYYSCFLNGIPIVEVPERSGTSGDKVSSTTTGFQCPYAPLTMSQEPPSITRILSPEGPLMVVIDGRWKIFPTTVNLSSLDAMDMVFMAPLYAYNSTDQVWTTVTNRTINFIPAYKVGVQLVKYEVDGDGIQAEDSPSTSGSLTTGQSYYYKLTYKNKAFGLRSPATALGDAVVPTNGAVDITVHAAHDPQADAIELWRSGGTLSVTEFRLLTTIDDPGTATTTFNAAKGYTDTTADADIALNELLDDTLVYPFPALDSSGASYTLLDGTSGELTTLGPWQGQYIIWLGDPQRPSAFYWNAQANPDLSTADLSYNAIMDPGEEAVNGCVLGGQPLVFSKRRLYALDYAGDGVAPAFVPREVPLGMGLNAKWGFTPTRAGVWFVSADGIYLTDAGGGPPTLVSEQLSPIFRGQQVETHPAVDWANSDDIRLVATSREIHFFYPHASYTWGGLTYPAGTQHLVLDLPEMRWARWNDAAVGAYQLEGADKYVTLFFKNDGNILYSDDANYEGNETFACAARTGSWDSGIPLTDKGFGVLMLDFDPDGAEITITPRYNSDFTTGTPFYAGTAGDTDGRRVKTFSLGDSDVFKRSISFEFSWTETATAHPKFYQAQIQFREDEEGVVHWYHPPTSLGNEGWYHIKDSYWTLRSSAAVTLTVTVDGVSDSYTLASTGSVREKVYQELRPRRGKLFSFQLESSQPFYFYGEESGLLGKPWKTSTGYKTLNPFGAAGYAQYLRKEGGT